MARSRRHLLPKDFDALCQAGDLDALKAVYNRHDLDAYGDYECDTVYEFLKLRKGAAPCFPNCPDELIRWLVERGLNVDTADRKEQRTALWQRAQAGRDLTVLLELGADVNAVNKSGETPLIASANRHLETVQTLLDHGAEVNTIDKSGSTPLHKAALQHLEIVQLLLDHGAQINVCTQQGTPLHFAVWRPQNIQFLLDHGAQINARSLGRRGRTALEEALHHTFLYKYLPNLMETIQLLLNAGAAVPTNIRKQLEDAREMEARYRIGVTHLSQEKLNEIDQSFQTLYRMFGISWPAT